MFIEQDESMVDYLIDEIKQETDEKNADKVQEFIRKAFIEDEGVKVLRYRLLPDMLCKEM